MTSRIAIALTLTALATLAAGAQVVFRSGVDLVHLTVTVSDRDGRFIPGLGVEDFTILDDGKPQPIVSFSSERIPVSLGVLLDVSLGMGPARMVAARAAIRRFTGDLLGADDELFLATTEVRLLQPWTADRRKVSDALPVTWGTTGQGLLYDAVREVLPIAAAGTRSKKALLVLTDGNDHHSRTQLKTLQERIRASGVLVYALGLGVYGRGDVVVAEPTEHLDFGYALGADGRVRIGVGIARKMYPDRPMGRFVYTGSGLPVNAGNLRKMTDVTGGRTEVIKEFSDVDAATARVAEELNQQYTMAYAAPDAKDGAWHTIKVEVRRRGASVRTRSGYQAHKVE